MTARGGWQPKTNRLAAQEDWQLKTGRPEVTYLRSAVFFGLPACSDTAVQTPNV